MPVSYTRQHIEQFAKVLAKNDRRFHPRQWVIDDTIIAALRGHALCFANAHRIQVELSHNDIAFGLKTYRRVRGLRRPHRAATALPLIAVQGRVRHGNAA